jgi:hypothetical protein
MMNFSVCDETYEIWMKELTTPNSGTNNEFTPCWTISKTNAVSKQFSILQKSVVSSEGVET